MRLVLLILVSVATHTELTESGWVCITTFVIYYLYVVQFHMEIKDCTTMLMTHNFVPQMNPIGYDTMTAPPPKH